MNHEAVENKISVLVVEMDPMCRRVVERILSSSCRITTCSDYAEILDLLRRIRFDTLFVDNDLPPPGVIALFKEARQISPGTKRVLMTGENVVNLQHYLDTGLVSAFVTRTTSSGEIEREVTTPVKKDIPLMR
jgi:DNA-binding NtrC family response regulator